MAINQPIYDVNNFSFGPGVCYIGPSGTTPTNDMGGVRSGMELRVTRELLEVFQGSPRTRVRQWAVQETVEFTITGIEWNLIQLARIAGAGVTIGATNAGSTWSFGGDTNVLESALLFRHVMPVGHTIDVYIWRCQPSAEMRIPFGDEVHEFGASFRANTSTLDWGGTALPSVQQLVRIRRFV